MHAVVSANRRSRTVDAVVTFTSLMHALERDDLVTAAAARERLDTLGVRVRFPRRNVRADQQGGVR